MVSPIIIEIWLYLLYNVDYEQPMAIRSEFLKWSHLVYTTLHHSIIYRPFGETANVFSLATTQLIVGFLRSST